jgi:hypothetical protein
VLGSKRQVRPRNGATRRGVAARTMSAWLFTGVAGVPGICAASAGRRLDRVARDWSGGGRGRTDCTRLGGRRAVRPPVSAVLSCRPSDSARGPDSASGRSSSRPAAAGPPGSATALAMSDRVLPGAAGLAGPAAALVPLALVGSLGCGCGRGRTEPVSHLWFWLSRYRQRGRIARG